MSKETKFTLHPETHYKDQNMFNIPVSKKVVERLKVIYERSEV